MPSNHERDQESQSAHVSPTPLPKFQLFMVALMQGAEPITATVIYPFIAPLVAHTGVTKGDEKAIGYYAGTYRRNFPSDTVLIIHCRNYCMSSLFLAGH